MEPYLSEYAEEVARLTAAVNETRTTLESDYTTTNERISNIIAVNNSTADNSELRDIRLDADGTTHASAGDAVRSIMPNVKNNKEIISILARDVSTAYDIDLKQTLKFRSGTPALPTRQDYIFSINPIIIKNGDSFTINYDFAEQVNRIIYYYYDKAGTLLNNSYFSLITTGSRTITCNEEAARYLHIGVWSGNTSVTYDPADFTDRVSVIVNPKEITEFTPQDLFDFTVTDLEANDMYVTPERLTWNLGLLSDSDGETVTSSRMDYVHTKERLAFENSDIVTIDFSSFSDDYYATYIKYAFSYYYDENDEFISKGQAAKVSFNSTNRSLTFNPPNNARSIRIALWSASGSVHQDIDTIRRSARVYKNKPNWMLEDTVQNLSLINDTAKSYVTRILGATDPQWIGEKFALSSEYITKMREAITAWMTAYAGDQTKVPFIVCTDQHGRLNNARKQIFDVLSHIVNWDGVSAFFNLGDGVGDHWEADDTNENEWLRNAELERASVCLSSIPRNKMIAVYGNHDTWARISENEFSFLPNKKYLNPYFTTGKQRTVTLPDNSGNMVIYDDYWNVKYVVVANWDYTTSYSVFKINANHWRWIIKELEKNDGYDVIIVSHVPIVMRSINSFDPITNESLSGSTYYIDTAEAQNVFNARQKKTAGTIEIDSEIINYDFTQCETPLLCSLCGHTHHDGIDRAGGSNGLMVAAFDWFNQDTLHFGIIDRENNTLNVWKLSNDTTPIVETWTQPLYIE